ncbi:hypothetical protein Ddye_001581 [Dipteronia dyeriana]|uniref:Peptidase A2 domain-containing protein n=1 Tax=Dipteronia dyeriana TaxID=168575 RepID=A0AAD9XPA9_9ROSI|nr:hypothetical protein Ddye_001581 [Dipteronia dyeriana]
MIEIVSFLGKCCHNCKKEFNKGYKDNSNYFCKDCKAITQENEINRAGSELILVDVEILYKARQIKTKAMIDTGANKCIIHESLAPEEYRIKLGANIGLRTFSENTIQITECLINISIRINGETHYLPQTLITNQPASYKFVLGLNFILGNNGSMLITHSGVNFFKKSTFIQPKLETSNFPYEKKVANLETTLKLEYENSILEALNKEPEESNLDSLTSEEMIDYHKEICMKAEEQRDCKDWPIEIR